MSRKKLLQSDKVHRNTTSRQELTEIRRLVARDLADATITALSEDRRFATAYNAALQNSEDSNRMCRIQSRKRARPSSLNIRRSQTVSRQASLTIR